MEINLIAEEQAETIHDLLEANASLQEENERLKAVAERPVSKEGRKINRRRGRMVQIEELIAELEEIKGRFGNTCCYVTGLSWGSVALWKKSDYDSLHPEPEQESPK